MTPILPPLEARVLGVLIEKERTVPDSYPFTLNSLLSGCNQKTSRDPIMSASESEVQAAVDALRSKSLIIETSGGRVARYSHNFERVLRVPRQASALLAVLMLRGPQTVGELRINCERLHAFADISSVEAFLRELAERLDGALVAELPRQPGARENRWIHLLSGAPAAPREQRMPAAGSGEPGTVELDALKVQVARIDGELRELKALVTRICAQLDIRT
jgi:uncharacterized protein